MRRRLGHFPAWRNRLLSCRAFLSALQAATERGCYREAGGEVGEGIASWVGSGRGEAGRGGGERRRGKRDCGKGGNFLSYSSS